LLCSTAFPAGDGSAGVAHGDLKQDRGRTRAPMGCCATAGAAFAPGPPTRRASWRITCPDAEARRQKRRTIAFETDR
jgi:hypothetical protein